MDRNFLLAVALLLALGVGALGYKTYQEAHSHDGVAISIGRNGVNIQPK
jgi:hypothetical protein